MLAMNPYLKFISPGFFVFIGLWSIVLAGCHRAGGYSSQESTISAATDWQYLDQKTAAIPSCEIDHIVAMIVRKFIEKDEKTFGSSNFRNLLYTEIHKLIQTRGGLKTSDLKSILSKVVSVNGKPNPYLVKSLGYSPDHLLLPLMELALFLENRQTLDRSFATIMGFLSVVDFSGQRRLESGIRLGLRLQHPQVQWDQTPLRWFHLDVLTHVALDGLVGSDHLDHLDKLPKLKTLLVNLQDKAALGVLSQILAKLPSLQALYVKKKLQHSQINIVDLNVLTLEKYPNIKTLGLNSNLGFYQSSSNPDLWNHVVNLKPMFTHIKTFSLIDGSIDNGQESQKDFYLMLRNLSKIKQFDTLEILEFSGKSFSELPPADFKVPADQVRIRSKYFFAMHPDKPLPVINLDVLKYVFSDARYITLDGVLISEKKLMRPKNNWESLTITNSIVKEFNIKSPIFNIKVDVTQDQALKKITLNNSPTMGVDQESLHLMEIRRTPILAVAFNWQRQRELDKEVELISQL